MNPKHLTNFVSSELMNKLEQCIGNHQFPWYWRPSSQHGIEEKGLLSQDFQFIHMVYYDNQPQSSVFELVKELLFSFEKATGIIIKNVYKIKSNLIPRQTLNEAGLKETIHTDIDKTDKKTFISMVYYVIDSDGDTVVYDESGEVIKSVSPVKGTAVYFSSHSPHRATPPIENKRRIVLNIVMEI